MIMPSSTGALFEDDMPATITFELDAWMTVSKGERDSYEEYARIADSDDL